MPVPLLLSLYSQWYYIVLATVPLSYYSTAYSAPCSLLCHCAVCCVRRFRAKVVQARVHVTADAHEIRMRAVLPHTNKHLFVGDDK